MRFTKWFQNQRNLRITSGVVLALFAILATVGGIKAFQIKTQYSMSQFKPKNHPVMDIDKKVKNTFGLIDSSPHMILLTLAPEDKRNWLHADHLKTLSQLTAKIKKIKNVRAVLSLSNVEAAITSNKSFAVGTVYDLSKQNRNLDWITRDPLMTPNLISKDGRTTVVFVTPRDMGVPEHSKLMTRLRTEANALFYDVKIQLGGPAAIRTQMTALIGQEIVLFIGLSLLGAILVQLAVFGGFSASPLTLFILLVGNLIALGWISAMGMSFTVLSTTIPILITITVLGITTHTMVHLSQTLADLRTADFVTQRLAIFGVIRKLMGSHFMTGVTTAVGFATLIPEDVPLISEFGLSVVGAVLIGSTTTIILIPTLLMWLPIPKVRNWSRPSAWIADTILKFQKPIFWGTVASFAIFGLLGVDQHWTARLFNDLPGKHEARVTTELASQKLGGVIPLELALINSKDPTFWSRPENIQKLDGLLKSWRELKGVGSVIGLPDFLRTATPNKSLPKRKSAIAEMLFVFSMAESNPVSSFLTENQKATRVAIRFEDLPSDRMAALVDKMRSQAQQTFHKIKVETAGLAVTVHPMNNRLSENLMYGVFTALAVIVLILGLVFRSFRWAAVSALPNLLPPVILLGTLAATNTPIKPGVALVFAIALGMAFDNTVYFLTYLKQLLQNGRYTILPVRETLIHKFNPCLISSLCLMAGFSAFLFSYFDVNRTFGLFMMLSIFAGLVGDLLFLPILLERYPNLLGRHLLQPLTPTSAEESKPMIQKIAASIALVSFVSVSYSAPSQAGALSAQDILSKLQTSTTAPNESATIRMQIKDSEGSKKERVIVIKHKKGDEQKSMVKLLSPADLKGVALLSVNSKEKEDQWLYLPSSKSSRRIAGSNKKGKFLDSDLTYEDLSVDTYKNFNNKVKSHHNNVAVIESLAKSGSESSYGMVRTWVSTLHYRIEKVEYYSPSKKLIKTMTFSRYEKIDNKYWRARLVEVKDLTKKRTTSLELQKISTQTLPDNEFSLAALED